MKLLYSTSRTCAAVVLATAALLASLSFSIAQDEGGDTTIIDDIPSTLQALSTKCPGQVARLSPCLSGDTDVAACTQCVSAFILQNEEILNAAAEQNIGSVETINEGGGEEGGGEDVEAEGAGEGQKRQAGEPGGTEGSDAEGAEEDGPEDAAAAEPEGTEEGAAGAEDTAADASAEDTNADADTDVAEICSAVETTLCNGIASCGDSCGLVNSESFFTFGSDCKALFANLVACVLQAQNVATQCDNLNDATCLADIDTGDGGATTTTTVMAAFLGIVVATYAAVAV